MDWEAKKREYPYEMLYNDCMFYKEDRERLQRKLGEKEDVKKNYKKNTIHYWQTMYAILPPIDGSEVCIVGV